MDETREHARWTSRVGRNVKVEVLLFFEQYGDEMVVSNRNCEFHKVT